VTGSARTYDAILYGTGPQGAERKRRSQPLLKKPITSELGGVGPTVVLPGKWSKADIRFQAENVTQVAGSYGGVVFMVLAVLFILVLTALVAWPASILPAVT